MGNPMYRQIAETLREQIQSGELQPGQQLKTELELREAFGASRNTVRDAIKLLTSRGLVETRPGQGTFVVKETSPFVTTLSANQTGLGIEESVRKLSEVDKKNRKVTTSPVQVEIQEGTENVTAALRLPRNAEVISRHEKRFIDGDPWSLQTSYYPAEFAERAERLRSARNIDEGTVKYLADTLHLRQVGYRDWIIVRTPNNTEAEFFRLPPDGRIAVYEISRTTFDGNQNPIRVTVTVYAADRCQFIVEDGEVPPVEEQLGRPLTET